MFTLGTLLAPARAQDVGVTNSFGDVTFFDMEQFAPIATVSVPASITLPDT